MSVVNPEDQPPPGPEHPMQAPSGPRAPAPVALSQHPPMVTYSLIALTVLVYLAQVGSQMFMRIDIPAAWGMKVNALIVQGEFWRLITPVLLHGGLLHIGFNMYALNSIGPFLESSFGARRFLLLYLVSGFAGNVFSFIFTDANSLGASTSVFGVFAAQGIFIYQNQAIFGSRSRQMLNQIIMLALVNLIIGMQAGIDNWGHVGGLLGGLAFAWFAGPKLAWEGILPHARLTDRRPPAADMLAALGVGLVFACGALYAIFLRS